MPTLLALLPVPAALALCLLAKPRSVNAAGPVLLFVGLLFGECLTYIVLRDAVPETPWWSVSGHPLLVGIMVLFLRRLRTHAHLALRFALKQRPARGLREIDWLLRGLALGWRGEEFRIEKVALPAAKGGDLVAISLRGVVLAEFVPAKGTIDEHLANLAALAGNNTAALAYTVTGNSANKVVVAAA